MASASAPFAVPARGRRKRTDQKRDACAVNDTVEHLIFFGGGQGRFGGVGGWGGVFDD